MSEHINSPLFFLGANSAHGFVSYFKDVYDPLDSWQSYIIKGGPGTGKSSLIRRVISEMAKNKQNVEIVPCSSDPASLDAAVFPDIKACIMDGTAPHAWVQKHRKSKFVYEHKAGERS